MASDFNAFLVSTIGSSRVVFHATRNTTSARRTVVHPSFVVSSISGPHTFSDGVFNSLVRRNLDVVDIDQVVLEILYGGQMTGNGTTPHL